MTVRVAAEAILKGENPIPAQGDNSGRQNEIIIHPCVNSFLDHNIDARLCENLLTTIYMIFSSGRSYVFPWQLLYN